MPSPSKFGRPRQYDVIQLFSKCQRRIFQRPPMIFIDSIHKVSPFSYRNVATSYNAPAQGDIDNNYQRGTRGLPMQHPTLKRATLSKSERQIIFDANGITESEVFF